MMLRILRDNYFVNSILRMFVLGLVKISKRAKWIADRYRVYGTVYLDVENVGFRIFSKGDDFIANDIYYGLEYEILEFRLIKAFMRKGRYFIDVGANTGIFSIFCSSINSDIKVLSFEPHPENYKRLLKNIGLNTSSQIQSYQLAVGNSMGTISFTIPLDDSLSTTSSANESFTRNFSAIQFKNIPVKQTSLDLFLSSYPICSIDLIKIDVEYYEYEVLQGAVEILSTKQPLLLLEVLNYDKLVGQFPEMEGKLKSNHANQIEKLLSDHGYFAYQLLPDGVKFVTSVSESRAGRNFLFSTKYLSDQLIPYNQLADTYSSLL